MKQKDKTGTGRTLGATAIAAIWLAGAAVGLAADTPAAPATPAEKQPLAGTWVTITPDCLHVEKAEVLGTGGEAPAIFKHDGIYYLLHSHLTGLGVNENFYHTATNIWGRWQAMGKIAQGEHSLKSST